MRQRILVPLDGTLHSERIFPWLEFMLGHLEEDSEVVLCRSFEAPSEVYSLPDLSKSDIKELSIDYFREKILGYLETKRRTLQNDKVKVEIAVGEAATTILSRAPNFDLILMSGHGRGGLGRWLLGSTTTKVVRTSKIPVMVVGGRTPEVRPNQKKGIKTILVPLDGSAPAEKAYELACQYAVSWNADVWLYQGVSDVELSKQIVLSSNTEELESAQAYLRDLSQKHENVQTFVEVKPTYGESGILSAAEEKQVDLIVMGSRGKSAIERWLLGSETESALRLAKCPVIVVP